MQNVLLYFFPSQDPGALNHKFPTAQLKHMGCPDFGGFGVAGAW